MVRKVLPGVPPAALRRRERAVETVEKALDL